MDKKHSGIQFRFKKNDSIGSAEAEFDEAFLQNCFIDTGDLDALRSFEEGRRIIVGRTGAGKSALIKTLIASEDNVIELKPEELALNFLSNSLVLRFFEDAGSHLDVFYQLLWKHVISVELIKKKYKITNEIAQRGFFERLTNIFNKDRAKEQAMAYLQQWGSCFWNETESRVREVTKKIEDDLKASIQGTNALVKLEAGASEKLTLEEKHEVTQRGARAVSQVQISALGNVLKLLEQEIFNDAQEGYFVVIDDLDSRWAEDQLKFKLIRALMETVKSFRQVRRVKIVIALRQDLLQRVINATKDSGFQSEKYASMYLSLRWTKDQIVELVNLRLQHLVKQRYTSRPVDLSELFPNSIRKEKFADFLCDRTALRPRDAILFINQCLGRAVDRNQVTVQIITDAEAAYSEGRVTSLQEEWGGIYPLASEYLSCLSGRSASFNATNLLKPSIEQWAIEKLLIDRTTVEKDPVATAAKLHFEEGKGTTFGFLLQLLDALYCMGIVGIKPDPSTATYWPHYSDHSPSSGSIKPNSTVYIHPTFWRALGVDAGH